MRRALLALALTTLVFACGDDSDQVTTEETTNASNALHATYAMSDEVTDAEVERLVEILENRLEALGVDDPSVVAEGDTVRIAIPTVAGADQSEVAELVGVTAELRFRPVLLSVPLPVDDAEMPLTRAEDDAASEEVVLDEPGAYRYRLGPSAALGTIVDDADAQLSPSGSWQIALEMTVAGIDEFNEVAASCSPPSETCPTGQLAIVLDSIVRSAPSVQTAAFERDEIVIAGSFTEDEAKDLATILRYGSLPTSLKLVEVEPAR